MDTQGCGVEGHAAKFPHRRVARWVRGDGPGEALEPVSSPASPVVSDRSFKVTLMLERSFVSDVVYARSPEHAAAILAQQVEGEIASVRVEEA